MAVRSSSPRDDEDALDPVEAADEDELDEVDVDEALIEGEDVFDDEPDDVEDVLDAPDDLTDEQDDEDPDSDVEVESADEIDADATPVLPREAEFDDDDDDTVAAVVSDEVDTDDEIEGVRDGEFVCRSCHMAKRDTQLADADQLLCRDCA